MRPGGHGHGHSDGTRPGAVRAATHAPGKVLALGVATAGNVVAVLPAALVGGLAIFMRADLRLDQADIGVVVAVFFGVSALSSIPGGRLADALGAAWAMRLGATVTTAVLLGIAVFADSSTSLVVLLAVAGVANGIGLPASNLAVARVVAPGRLGLAYGIKQSAIPLAALLAGSGVPLLGLTVGWRWAFVSGALLAAAVFALAPAVGRAATQDHPARTGRSLGRHTTLLALGAGCGTAAGIPLSTFLVESAAAAGFRPATAGLLLAMVSGVCIGSRVLSGWWTDRRQGRHLLVVAAMLIGGGCGYALLSVGAENRLLFAFGAVCAFAAGWGWPGVLQYAVVTRNLHAPALASGVLQAGGATGGVIGPLLFGLLVARNSFAVAWAFAVGMAALGACLVLAGRRRQRQAHCIQ